MRKQRLTFHMRGILQTLSDAPVKANALIPTALVCLAMHGYVKVGEKARLTRKGRDLMQSGRMVVIGAYL
jgi:hypothetical protein